LKFGLGAKVALQKVVAIAVNYPKHASTGDETILEDAKRSLATGSAILEEYVG
jgi:hypothetical protein